MAFHVVIISLWISAIAGSFSLIYIFNWELPVEAWFPFDPFKNLMNFVTANQIIVITFTACAWRGVAMQGIVCSIVLYLCDQLVDIQTRIANLKYSSKEDTVMRRQFKFIIDKHIRLMGYSHSLMGIFKEYFLIQNVAVTLGMCLNAIMITAVGFQDTTLFGSFVAFLTVALLNAYIYCYLGDNLMEQSKGVAVAAYNVDWTSWPVDMQKDLFNLITVSQRPLKLSAGGMTVMSLQSFSLTLYNGYSIFTVLNDMVN